jgi:salicylate hydroxylase
VKGRPDIELILGTTISEAKPDSSGVSVATDTEIGSTGYRGSALIAADGVWSTLRALVDGANQPRPAGRTAWRAMIPSADASLGASSVGLWLGPAAHLVHYPVAKGSAINIVAIVEEEWPEEGWNAPGDGNWLLARFASWCEPARQMLAAPTEWRKFGLASVDPRGPWIKGPVALLGDAAHAMMPFMAQGAAMAIEDAAVLASALTAAGDDAPAGLRAYEAARRPRVTRVSEAARKTGEYFHWDEPRAGVRNAMLRLVGPSLVLGRSDWIYGWKPGAANGEAAIAVPAHPGIQ